MRVTQDDRDRTGEASNWFERGGVVRPDRLVDVMLPGEWDKVTIVNRT